jgi:hemerythrin superfamily protein
MKATQLLKTDHATVKRLFVEFGRTTNRAERRREQLLDRIATELEIHTAIEEEIFYPAVKDVSAQGERFVSEAQKEHKEVDGLVAEAQGMKMTSDEVATKVKEIRDAVVHHAGEEEREMFPFAERTLRDRLEELGAQMASRKHELATSRLQQAKRIVKKAIRQVA